MSVADRVKQFRQERENADKCGDLSPYDEQNLEEICKLLEQQGDLLEAAWGVIANASYGDWEKQSPKWREAARNWRDKYHKVVL